MEKSIRKCAPKASPRPLLILLNNTNSHCTQEILLTIRYSERGLSKSLKKVKFIFSFEPSPFKWTNLSKTKGVWNYSPVPLQVMKQVQKNSFNRYILSDQV